MICWLQYEADVLSTLSNANPTTTEYDSVCRKLVRTMQEECLELESDVAFLTELLDDETDNRLKLNNVLALATEAPPTEPEQDGMLRKLGLELGSVARHDKSARDETKVDKDNNGSFPQHEHAEQIE